MWRCPRPRQDAYCRSCGPALLNHALSSLSCWMVCGAITSIGTPISCRRFPRYAGAPRGSVRRDVNFLPTNTAVGHSTIATGADPGIHGVTANNIYDRLHRRRLDAFAGTMPQVLMTLTLADVWQLTTSGRAIVLAQGSIDRAATPLAGHGACQPNGAPVVLASYDEATGFWHSNSDCFRLPDYLKDRNASTLWSVETEWLHHRIDSPAAVRRSALFPAFEADAMIAMIEHEPLGEDSVADLVLLNYKRADFVGHRYGPDSNELRLTLGEMDRNLARIIDALEAKVGKDYLLAVTADHGMPSAPPERRHLAPALVDLLHEKFDPQAKQLVTSYEPENAQIFVDEDRLLHLGLTLGDLARFLEAQPFIFAVFTQDEVRRAAEPPKITTPRASKRSQMKPQEVNALKALANYCPGFAFLKPWVQKLPQEISSQLLEELGFASTICERPRNPFRVASSGTHGIRSQGFKASLG